MKKTTLVSVVIPVKGRVDFASQAIKSVLEQKEIDPNQVEIITVEERKDKDRTNKSLKKIFPKIKTMANQFEEGIGGSRQTGLQACLGKYVLFLDSDDRLNKSYLYIMIKFLKSDRDSSAVICLSESKFEKGFQILNKMKLIPLIYIRDVSFLISFFLNSGYLFNDAFYLCQLSHMVFRTSRIRKCNFDYRYRSGGEDWNFLVKVLQHGQIRIVLSYLLKFRYSFGSSTYQPVQLRNKWDSYNLLVDNLPKAFKRGIYYNLFLLYITLFGGKYVSKN